MTADELMAMVDGLCEAAYSAQDTEALRASLRTALEAVVEGCRQETAPAQGLTDEQIDALNRSAQDAAISTGIPPHRALVRAALAAAPQPVPVANSRPLSELIARDEAIPERAAALEKARAAAAPHTAAPASDADSMQGSQPKEN